MKAIVNITDPDKYAKTVDSVNLEGCKATAMVLEKQWQRMRFWAVEGTVIIVLKDGQTHASTGEHVGDDFAEEYGFEITGENA